MSNESLTYWVLLAQVGDSEAISQLFHLFRNDVYSIALRETKNRILAEDIVQETFVEVICTVDNLKAPEAFPAWLKQIAYHQCTRHFKRKETKHEVLVAESKEGFSVFDTLEERNTSYIPDEALDQKEFKAIILNLMDELPEVQSSALRMFYFDELSLKAIAEVQGVSVNTANTRLNRGRKAMQSTVESYEKKHGIRLHTVVFFPFFKWLLAETQLAMPAEAAETVAAALSAQFGIAITASESGAAAGTGAAASAGSTATAGTVGLGAKILAAPVANKVISGVLAASVAVGGVVGYQIHQKQQESLTVTVSEVVHSTTESSETIAVNPIFSTTTETQAEMRPLVSDAFYDYLPENAYPGGESFFHIPKVNADLPHIEETNAQIYDIFYNYLQEHVYQYTNNGGTTSLSRMTYIWGTKDDYLSILMYWEFGDPISCPYNISLETGRIVEDQEILSLYDLTWEDFVAMVNAKASLAGDKFLSPVPYINPGNGDLCANVISDEWGWNLIINLTGSSEPVRPWNNPESIP